VSRTLVGGEAFELMLTSLQSSAFRLEALPQYLVDSEAEAFSAYQRGELLLPPRSKDQQWWEALVREHAAAGRVLQRVHVLPDVITPYLRFEIEWGYAYTQAAGERVHFLPTSAPPAVRRAATQDFWLLDDRILVYAIYDGEGRFLRLEKEEDKTCLANALQQRDDLLAHAVALRDIVRTLRGLR